MDKEEKQTSKKTGKKKRKRSNKLSVVDRKIVKNVLEGMTYEKAGKLAKPETKYPRQFTYQALQKDVVRAALKAGLEKAGLDEETIAKRIAEITKAKDIKYIEVVGGKNGEKEKIKAPNWDARARALHMVNQMIGGYQPQQIEVSNAYKAQEFVIQAMREATEGCERCRSRLAMILSGQSSIQEAEIIQDVEEMEEKCEVR